ncbi:FGGY family carbohydrate kinase [Streptomyces brasiliensis]|uniref:Glycerol kinase n=1 Tax=Streptomyces brasiliensis TaxID=1954 RepID=A0A917KTD5_9ACTN|nr:FGGY family carbohydrate kinase [Streptomyces brasiliensis]GGJ29018.1 glycerol kinase [Streptomyces brasiliensis]
MERLVLAVDQGTSSTKALLVNSTGRIVGRGEAPLSQSHPAPGLVEQDALALLASVRAAVAACLNGTDPRSVAGIGLSTQRESVVLWETATGQPVAPLVSWQDQRGSERAAQLAGTPFAGLVRRRTGLPLDPMFSALKMAALLDEHDPARERVGRGELRLGTVDSWLVTAMTGAFVTEIGNASRTQLLDLGTGAFDGELLEVFGIPRPALGEVIASSGPFGHTRGFDPLPDGVPVVAVLGDSHAALFAHAGWRPGVTKATYGTGSSVMTLTSSPGAAGVICDTIAWSADQPSFAQEANIRSSGRTLTWLADLLGTPVEKVIELAANSDSDGVTLVPAFGGIGAPWWDPQAQPLLAGFSLGTGRGQLARAALESVAHQVDDVLDAMSGIDRVMADGGLTRSTALMQLQADLSGVEVARTHHPELSAAGAADLAGLVLGLWTASDLEKRADHGLEVFTPAWTEDRRKAAASQWHERLLAARELGARGNERTS